VCRLAARMLAVKGGSPVLKQYAFQHLAQSDAVKEQLPAITRLFSDAAVLMPGAPNTPLADELQVRDAALVVAVRATGQDTAAYGLDAIQPLADGFQVNPLGYRFRTDKKKAAAAKRDAAFQKWAEWEAKNPAGKK
jgi:hypothetical protein